VNFSLPCRSRGFHIHLLSILLSLILNPCLF
jgi:hypothetical protein